MSLACIRITSHFHPNHFALKQRLGATWKWPINLVHLYSELVVIKALVVIHSFCVNYVFLLSEALLCMQTGKLTGLWFRKDAKERRAIFAESAQTLGPQPVTPRFHPLAPEFSFNRSLSRALLTSAKIRAVLPCNTHVAIDKIQQSM